MDKLFTATQVEAIKKLWADEDVRKEIQKQVGKRLLDNNDIIKELPLTQIMLLTSLADFASDSQECCDIAEIIFWGLNKENILPSIVEHRKEELAYRCLLSLGFFKQTLVSKCNRYGAPSPNFYREVGVNTFIRIGKEDIGYHFRQWEHFMGEFFI